MMATMVAVNDSEVPFASRLRALLSARSLTQADLVRMSRVPAVTVSNLLGDNSRLPNLATAVRIANALNVSLYFLAGRTTDQNLYHAIRLPLELDEAQQLVKEEYDSFFRRVSSRLKKPDASED